MAAPQFLPSRDGLAFDNNWPPAPGLAIATPLGTLGLGNAAAGLCGGMIFTALDYWQAGLVPPAVRPAPGSEFYRYIVRRLIDSWHVPAGVARYYLWMNLPDGDRRAWLPGRRRVTIPGVSRRTIEQHWPRVRASIGSGRPAALGVVTTASARPDLLGHNHQVLGYDYRVTGSVVALHVYDPNSGPDDDVRIVFDTARPAEPTRFEHNISIRGPVRGFFLTGYSAALPSAG
jgi:hypothetical protein